MSAAYKEISFSKNSRRVTVGLSWDISERRNVSGQYIPHDLDLSCVLYTADKKTKDVITPSDPKRGEYKEIIFHSGDHQSGASEFEDETIHVNVDKLPLDIAYIAFFVSGKERTKIEDSINASAVMMDGVSLEVFSKTDLPPSWRGKKTDSSHAKSAYLTGVLKRGDAQGVWLFSSEGAEIPVTSEYDMRSTISTCL